MHGTLSPAIRVAQAIPSNVRLAIFLGSCEEYGNTTPPMVEAGPLKVASPYGWAKIAGYEAVSLLARHRGFPLCWVRPFVTFGPGQGGEFVVPNLIRACLDGQPLQLSPGEQTRDFIFVKDVVAMLKTLLMCADKAAGQVVNLASGRPRTIREVGETIRQIIGQGELQWGAIPYRTDEPMAFYGSTDHWKKLFGHFEYTSFEEALRATITAAAAGGAR
jgi:nucleoside-diphosphate-sugar epimerase